MLNVKNEVLARIYVVMGSILIAAIVIAFQLHRVAWRDANKWTQKADSLYFKMISVEPDRGNIYSADGSLLATSLPFFDVYFDAKAEGMDTVRFMLEVDSLAYLLSTYVDAAYTPGAYKDWLVSLVRSDPNTVRGLRYVPIARSVSFQTAQFIKTFPIFRLGKHKGGLIIEQKSKRHRPFKLLAQRTIGYVRDDAMPVGLEGAFNNVLGGDPGKQLMVRTPGDIYIPVNDLAEIEPRSGDDLVTTLDINIQDVTENALLRACQTHNAHHGCAIVMDVKTGAIKAIANIGKGESGWWETYNYAVGERIEPGSVFKAASFLALLEDGRISDLDEQVPVYQGKYKFYNEELVDAVKHGKDSMRIRDVFAYSSNVGTATMINEHYRSGNGIDYVRRLEAFGLTLPSGIEIGGEEAPLIKNPKDAKTEWSGTTLPWMSIGYELLLTPLQILQFYNAIANDGRMMRPYLVQRIERYGKPVREYRPQTMVRNIASRRSIAKIQELMCDVVSYGTAKNIEPRHYNIAGKTGTTQLNYNSKRKSKSAVRYQASFCGFFPADTPKYSCIVVLSDPERGGFHGAEVAAPVFREIADKCMSLTPGVRSAVNAPGTALKGSALSSRFGAGRQEELRIALRGIGIAPEYEDKKAEWARVRAHVDTFNIKPLKVPDTAAPDVTGMGLKDALYLLENRGFKVNVRGVGRVARQSLSPGTKGAGRTPITIWLE